MVILDDKLQKKRRILNSWRGMCSWAPNPFQPPPPPPPRRTLSTLETKVAPEPVALQTLETGIFIGILYVCSLVSLNSSSLCYRLLLSCDGENVL